MEYLFEISLDDLKNLDHIEWFVLHSDEYVFKSERSRMLLEKLKRDILKKNVLYYVITKDYHELVSLINNNPYNYKYDVLPIHERKEIETCHIHNYFIEVEDNEENKYLVPYQYLLTCQAGHDMDVARIEFVDLLYNSKVIVAENFQAVKEHYDDYFEAGVSQALENYEIMNNGQEYHNVGKMILLFIYNILLYKAIVEVQFFDVLFHFWKFFSKDGDPYSAYSMYHGYIIFPMIALFYTAYFIYMDVIYIKGMYYSIYTKMKYDELYNHHNRHVLKYFKEFYQDYTELFSDQSLENTPLLTKANRRESTYIPLIRETAVRYDFRQKRKDGKYEFHSPMVLNKLFYSHPIRTRVIGLLFLCLFIEIISKAPVI